MFASFMPRHHPRFLSVNLTILKQPSRLIDYSCAIFSSNNPTRHIHRQVRAASASSSWGASHSKSHRANYFITAFPQYSQFQTNKSRLQYLRFLSTTPANNNDSDKLEHHPTEEPIILSTQKTGEPSPSISKVLSILLPEYKLLALAIGALTISTGATMQFPNAIGGMIDILNGVDVATLLVNVGGVDVDSTTVGETAQAIMGNDANSLQQQKMQMKSIAVEMMGYFTVGAIGTALHSAMFDTVGQKIGARLRKQLFTTIMQQPVAFFDQNRAGELANRLSTDVHEVAEHLVQNIALFMTDFVRIVTAIWSMIVISPTLTFYLSPVMPLLMLCGNFYGQFIKTLSKQHLDVLANSTHLSTERFSAITTVLSFGQKRNEVARYASVIEAAYGYARKVAIYQGAFLGSSQFVGNTALLGVLWVGSMHVFDGQMTAGQLAGFCMYAAILSESIGGVSESVGGFLKAQGSGARLFSLLDESSNVGSTSLDMAKTQPIKLLANFEPIIQFQNIQFSFPTHPSVQVLNAVSFSLLNGELLGLTGGSGSGKSSIIALLLRFYDPSHGSITLDGFDIKHLEIEWLRSQIGIVRQEPILFHGTILENVAYGKPDAKRSEVIQACIDANAHHFILDLPDGYDTVVGERGASISGGQKQRVSIARALLTRPRFLLLDEASSALDQKSEKHLLQSLRTLIKSENDNLAGVLFVTHKKSVMRACDRVIVLHDGNIIEKNDQHELC